MMSPANTRAFGELFGDHRAVVEELTGTDVRALWDTFAAGHTLASRGTTAMQLLWFANVALWADQHRVRVAGGPDVSAAPIV
jgi:hypothetical protein